MSEELMQMMQVQGEIKIRLIKAGLTQTTAHELAGELMDFVLKSPITNEEHRKVYESLNE
jgi:hypothetical protein